MIEMMKYCFLFVAALLIFIFPFNQVLGGKQEELGKSQKFRVLVDKVLMKENGWVMTEEHVKQIADAGFNVVSPREGGDDMHQVRLISQYAQKYGLYHIPWMRGTLRAKTGPKLVWSNGLEHPIYSPNSDELWAWMNKKILDYAKISVKNPSLIGVFLDFENYSFKAKKDASKRLGHAYPLSYDEKIIKEFFMEEKIALPNLEPSQRYAWLQKKGLHEKFSDFQIERWRTRAKKLRQMIDAVNPEFQFFVYISKGTVFLQSAALREWTTSVAPVVIASQVTYGRPSRLMPHMPALEKNRRLLLKKRRQLPKDLDPFFYIGGIDPTARSADPEFSGRNAVMISEISDGYWIFYEGPQTGKDHELYWKWFIRSNQAIDENKWKFWQEDRESPDPVLEMSQALRFSDWISNTARDVSESLLLYFSTTPSYVSK